MGRNRSLVWQFFDRIFENGKPTAVECKLCDQEYKYFGNTTNLKQHLMRKHPIQWDIAENGGLNATAKKRLEDAADKDHDISDIDQEIEAASAHIAREVNNKDSDEEWLDDPFQSTQEESYEVPRKKHKPIKIKREVPSPLPQHSRLRSSRVYEQDNTIGNTIFIPTEAQPVKDEYSVFGEYIANKMRKFKSSRTRGNLQQVITTMLWQAEYGVYDTSDAVKRILMIPMGNAQSNVSNEGDTTQNQEDTVMQLTDNNQSVENDS